MKIPKPILIKKPRKYLKRKHSVTLFDKVWNKCSEYVRRRDKFVCFTCNKPLDKSTAQAGHFRHGKSKPTYFDERQIRCQCIGCNHFLSGNLGIYGVKLTKILGTETVEQIIAESYKTKHWRIVELNELNDYFALKLKELDLHDAISKAENS